MIVDFSITNFGPIKNTVTLSFEADENNRLESYYVMEPIPGLRLLKLALIYGANASGKTTLIKALDFLRDLVLNPLDKKSSDLNYYPFAFDSKNDQDSSFELNFVCKSHLLNYCVHFNKKYIREETLSETIKGEIHVVFHRTTDEYNQLSHIEIDKDYKESDEIATKLEGATLWNNTVLGASLKTNIPFRFLNDIVDWFEDYLSPMISPDHNLYGFISSSLENGKIVKEDILKMMKRADLMITDILIRDDGEEEVNDLELLEMLRKRHSKESNKDDVKSMKVMVARRHLEFMHTTEKGGGLLRYDQESLGTQRFYQFSGLVDLFVRNSVFFSIDEVEASLHPDLFEFFLYSFLCNSKESQLLATTHYREFLINSEMVRPDAVWFTDKKTDGSTNLYSLMDFDEDIFTSNRSYYDAYKIGRLGAKPHIGDYYMDFYHEEKE